MAKSRFVEFDEFKKELSSIRRSIDDLYEATDGLKVWSEDAHMCINQNADNGEALEKRVQELANRIDKLSRRVQITQNSIEQKNSGTGAFVVIGAVAGIVAFLYLLGEINDLAKQIDILENKKRKKGARPVEDKLVEVPFPDDNNSGTSSEGTAKKEN